MADGTDLAQRSFELIQLARRLRATPGLALAAIDAEFIFRFERAWLTERNRLRRVWRERLGLEGSGPLSLWDYAIVLPWLELHRDEQVTTRVSELEGRPVMLNITQSISEYPDMEMGAAIQRLAELYGVLPSGSEWGAHRPTVLTKRRSDFLKFVLCGGERVPRIIWSAYLFCEKTRSRKPSEYLRPVQYIASGRRAGDREREYEPFRSGKKEPHSTAVRIRTWVVYFLTTRGGGPYLETQAVDTWCSSFGEDLSEQNFRTDRTRLFGVPVASA